ncbi:polysaccharide pyruvyl transferase family protein [Halovulum dunhuangense]|uniref:Polysaccharide pyruvyl transferase family protein n=1 Tax=Halovulum dunhuangense TaxID=1505036 RepID=A0A849L3L0_9RHOB|nr:polysaccharide pyruvyl transferase family protein [Halovulum dunhuangense]NNU80909.1 polysaccharide pyruvyl transferase family protein [Halovulum dunhuangense]
MTTVALIHFNHVLIDGKVGWPDPGTTDARPNYGDMLVCAAILGHLAPGLRTTRTGFGRKLTTPCDFALIRGSTYLSTRFNYRAAIDTLDSIDAPLSIVGLGAQAPTQDPRFLDDHADAREFVAKLAEKSKSISVRGPFTAELLTRLGARDIRITGCPSLFHGGGIPQVALPEALGSPRQRLGVSLHTGLRRTIYCRDPEAVRARHIEAMRYTIEAASEAAFFEQGVKSEFDAADSRLPMESRLAAARQVLDRIGGADALRPEDLVTHMVSVRGVGDWLDRAGRMDAVLGFRFHGNMAALLQSVPCFYWTYDSRLREFCDLYNLPWQDAAEQWRDPVRAILDHDWDAANAAFRHCYAELHAFYDENGVPHRLSPPAQIPARIPAIRPA